MEVESAAVIIAGLALVSSTTTAALALRAANKSADAASELKSIETNRFHYDLTPKIIEEIQVYGNAIEVDLITALAFRFDKQFTIRALLYQFGQTNPRFVESIVIVPSETNYAWADRGMNLIGINAEISAIRLMFWPNPDEVETHCHCGRNWEPPEETGRYKNEYSGWNPHWEINLPVKRDLNKGLRIQHETRIPMEPGIQ